MDEGLNRKRKETSEMGRCLYICSGALEITKSAYSSCVSPTEICCGSYGLSLRITASTLLLTHTDIVPTNRLRGSDETCSNHRQSPDQDHRDGGSQRITEDHRVYLAEVGLDSEGTISEVSRTSKPEPLTAHYIPSTDFKTYTHQIFQPFTT